MIKNSDKRGGVFCLTALEKTLNVEIINIEDYLKSGFDSSEYDRLQKLYSFINTFKDYEDIEIKNYINDTDFSLYNIHSTNDSYYIEKYQGLMTDENMDDVMQEYKCLDVTDETDVLELILRSMAISPLANYQ